jgi:MFS family permease
VEVPSDENCLLQVSTKLAHGSARGAAATAHDVHKKEAKLTNSNYVDPLVAARLGEHVWMGVTVALVFTGLVPFMVRDALSMSRKQRLVSEELKDPVSAESLDTSSPFARSSTCFETPELSKALVVAFTAPDFYHGCLLSTFIPYVSAEEGPRLVGSASVLIGSSSAMFALSVILRPLMGKLSDWCVAKTSHAAGRRFSLLLGILICVLGTYGCAISSALECVFLYYISVFVMRLGADCFKVTNEALVWELVPESQVDIVNGFKGAMFFLGSLISFIFILCVNLPAAWLYNLYVIVVLACVLPGAIALIQTENMPTRSDSDIPTDDEWLASALWSAYVKPMRYKGCFPRLCAAHFVYHIGLAPACILLLQLHDIVGTSGTSKVEAQWCYVSIFSTTLAALSSLALALQIRKDKSELTKEQLQDNILIRLQPWALSGLVAMASIPVIGLVGDAGSWLRSVLMYILTGAVCSTIGVCQVLFQEAVLRLLPDAARYPNAMCILAACNIAGSSLGGLGAGFLLQIWAVGEKSYELMGYAVLSLAILVLGLLSVYLIPRPDQVDTPEHPDRSRWLVGISSS